MSRGLRRRLVLSADFDAVEVAGYADMRENLLGFLEDFAIVVAPGYVSQVEVPDTGVQRQARRLARRQMAEFVRQVGFDVEVGGFDDQRIGPTAGGAPIHRSG